MYGKPGLQESTRCLCPHSSFHPFLPAVGPAGAILPVAVDRI
jgi:hypothetical protein